MPYSPFCLANTRKSAVLFLTINYYYPISLSIPYGHPIHVSPSGTADPVWYSIKILSTILNNFLYCIRPCIFSIKITDIDNILFKWFHPHCWINHNSLLSFPLSNHNRTWKNINIILHYISICQRMPTILLYWHQKVLHSGRLSLTHSAPYPACVKLLSQAFSFFKVKIAETRITSLGMW